MSCVCVPHRLNNNKPRQDTTFGPSEALNCWISQQRYDIELYLAVAAKLQLNDKLYDIIAKTCGHLSWHGCHNFGARELLKIALTSLQNS